MKIGNLQPLIETVPSQKKPKLAHRPRLGSLPPFPTGEQASGSQDQPKHNNPESDHGPKGKRGRPNNIQPNPPPVQKEIFKETPTAKAKA